MGESEEGGGEDLASETDAVEAPGDAAPEPAAEPAETETAPAVPEFVEGDELAALVDRKFKMKINGEERVLSFREALQDVSKGQGAAIKFEQAAKMRKEAEAAQAEAQQYIRQAETLFQVLSHPESLVQALEDGALPPETVKGIELWVRRRVEEAGLPPETRQAQAARRQVELERARLERERAAWEEERRSAETSRISGTVAAWVDDAVKGVGLESIPDEDRDVFGAAVVARAKKLIEQSGEQDVTPQIIADAVKYTATRMGLAKTATTEPASPDPAPAPQHKVSPKDLLPPTGNGSPPARPSGAKAKKEKVLISDFFESLRNLEE